MCRLLQFPTIAQKPDENHRKQIQSGSEKFTIFLGKAVEKSKANLDIKRKTIDLCTKKIDEVTERKVPLSEVDPMARR